MTMQLPEQEARTVGDSLNSHKELYIQPVDTDHSIKPRPAGLIDSLWLDLGRMELVGVLHFVSLALELTDGSGFR